MTDIIIPLSSILAICAAISAMAGAYLKVRKILKDRRESKELERALILQEAKELSHKHKASLEAKIEALSQKIANVEESVNKDLVHIKESYNSEIRHLGSKVEELKDEMRMQINQVVQLISKLIDKT